MKISTRKIPAFVIGATALALCVGCSATGVQQSNSGDSLPSLPQLSLAEGMRDQIARSEYAIAQASETMTALATECEECRSLLERTGDDAAARLAVVGGMWEPWADAQSGAELPEPPEVGNAPLLPASLVGYMLATAEEQLTALTEQTPELATPLAQVLTGRIASALVLANYYGIDPESASASVDPDQLATSVGEPLAVAQALPQSAQSGAVAPAEDALETFDCLATASGRTELITAESSVEQSLYDDLVTRQRDLIKLGVSDSRPIRCSTGALSVPALFNTLIAADISLLSSENSLVRAEGQRLLLEDIRIWTKWGNPETVAPGSTQSSAETEREDNE